MSNSETELLNKIKKIVAETLKISEDKLNANSSFVADLGADSLDQVELMMAFEAALECDIPDTDAAKMATIQDVITYVQQKTAA
jgi:acyl carrier protein